MSFNLRSVSGLAAIAIAGTSLFLLSGCGTATTPEQVAVNSAAPSAGRSNADQVTVVPLTVPNTIPFYSVSAEQSGEPNVPTVVTTAVNLTITP